MCHQGIEEYGQEETLEEGICEGGDVTKVEEYSQGTESVKEVMCHQGIEEYSQEETLEEGICEGGDVSPRNRGVQSGGNIGRGNL